MALWGGIDEAGYGPQLGPLVVAGAAFHVPEPPEPGALWDALADAVSRQARGSADRLVVNDSKKVNAGRSGLRRLEEGVLSFLSPCMEQLPLNGVELLRFVGAGRGGQEEPAPWFRAVAGISLPVATNPSAVDSKACVLTRALADAGARVLPTRAAIVLPAEFNRIVARTHNKSLLLFQKCGLVLQDLWRHAGPGESRILVDRHGGRRRYRRLLKDVFPGCTCDVVREDADGSTYRITDGERRLLLTFADRADAKALPTALASMTAKYLRELHMMAFNRYWQERVEGLRPTAGYHGDSGRFLSDIAPALEAEGTAPADLVRLR